MQTIGTVYNRWTLIDLPYKEGGHTLAKFRCACGVEQVRKLAAIKFGNPKSCGCLKSEVVSARNALGKLPVEAGTRYGRLTVLKEAPSSGGNRRLDCICDCGVTKDINLASLLNGNSKSCGCFRAETTASKNTTHGRAHTKLYGVWRAMRERCGIPTNPAYPNYGGRGIRVCKEWEESFEAFYADVGEPTFSGASLDRIDNNGDYNKANVRWATRAEQASNTRRNKLYYHKGTEAMLKDIATTEGINLGTLYYRINSMKLTLEEALALPFRKETVICQQ